MGANDKIRFFSTSNIVVLISGLFVTLSCACGIGLADSSPISPSRLSHFITNPDSLCFMCATSCAFVGLVSAVFVLLFEYLLIRNQFHWHSVGYGFLCTVAIFVVFVICFPIMFILLVRSACKVHKEVQRLGGRRNRWIPRGGKRPWVGSLG